MRKAYILAGLPGSGKTTMTEELRAMGLPLSVISADAIREVRSGVGLNPDGHPIIIQENPKGIWDEVRSIVRRQMRRGMTVAVEGVHTKFSEMRWLSEYARQFGYDVAMVDFFGVATETAIERDRRRAKSPTTRHRRTGEKVIRRLARQAADSGILDGKAPAGMRRITPARFRQELADVEFADLSSYSRIVHIGDLQGCMTPLDRFLDEEGGVREDSFYVFVGDYLDRGIENGEVMRWVCDHADLPNVVLLYGNHEKHLSDWAAGEEIVSPEFRERTLPQLIDAGIRRSDAARVVAACRDFFCYEYRGQRVFCNHAGLPAFPGNLLNVMAATQLWRGVNGYESPDDETYDRSGTDVLQFHGHRSRKGERVAGKRLSHALVGTRGVEFGGPLRVATMSGDAGAVSVSFSDYKNSVFRKPVGGRATKTWDWVLPKAWSAAIDAGDDGMRVCANTIRELESARIDKGALVKMSRSTSRPHIRAYNLSRLAMTHDVLWRLPDDAVPMRPRGLFVDNENRVVARFHDKFANIGEPGSPCEDAQAIAANFKPPFFAFKKENGYLGLLGYDPGRGELVFASKSQTDGDGEFADRFRRIAESQLSDGQMDKLRWVLEVQQMSLAFEVIDPVEDPHIIEYEREGIVLLDAFHRGERVMTLPHEELVKLGNYLGLDVKERMMTFESVTALTGFVKACREKPFNYRGAPIEGVVVASYDEAGRLGLMKLKMPYYNFVKRCRAIAQRIPKIRDTQKRMRMDMTLFDGMTDFRDWAMRRSDESLARPITEVIAEFFKERPDILERYAGSYVPPACENAEGNDPRMTGPD